MAWSWGSWLDGWAVAAAAAGANRKTPAPSNFEPKEPLTRLWQVSDVENNLRTPTHALVDARSEVRFRGEQEPIDPPSRSYSRRDLPSTENLTDTGHFKSAAELRERFAHRLLLELCVLLRVRRHPAHNVLAMRVAGHRKRLYT